ncbi:hypothetical protein [Streptomyces sp. NPDC050704]
MVLDVDVERERDSFSLKALYPDPLEKFGRVGLSNGCSVAK